MRRTRAMPFAFGVLVAMLSPGAVLCDESFERALSLATEKRYSEAREVLDPLLQRDPDNPRVRLLHGVLRTREGRVGESIDIFEALRRDYPDMSEPANNLAVLYAVEGRLDDARKILLAMLERAPDPIVYANLSDVYTKLARRAYERARALEASGQARSEPAMHTAFATPAPSMQATDAVPMPPQVEPEPADPAPQWRGFAPASRDSAPESEDLDLTLPPTIVTDTQAPDTESGETQQVVVGTVSTVSETASTPASFCAYAGRFLDRRAVADAALWLRSYGAEVLEVRHEERRTTSSYRVYLPPFASQQAAVAKLREIRKRGVRDVAVIKDGDLVNGISLGVYREADNMQRRVAALDQLGYSARSRAVELEIVKEYVIKAQAGGTPARLDAAWTKQFPEQPIRVVDCG